MKMKARAIATTGILIATASFAETNTANTNAVIVTTNCQHIIVKLTLMKTVSNAAPCQTVEEARGLIMKSINIANPQYERKPMDCGGYFLFSGMDTASQDNGLFKSGIAVKKGTAEIYRWGK